MLVHGVCVCVCVCVHRVCVCVCVHRAGAPCVCVCVHRVCVSVCTVLVHRVDCAGKLCVYVCVLCWCTVCVCVCCASAPCVSVYYAGAPCVCGGHTSGPMVAVYTRPSTSASGGRRGGRGRAAPPQGQGDQCPSSRSRGHQPHMLVSAAARPEAGDSELTPGKPWAVAPSLPEQTGPGLALAAGGAGTLAPGAPASGCAPRGGRRAHAASGGGAGEPGGAPGSRPSARRLPELERFFGALRLRQRPPTELLLSLVESCAEDALPVASLSRGTLS